MTTIAMVAGMVPSALALDEGATSARPWRSRLIGGLVFSTFLSLLFTPAFYALVKGRPAVFSRGRCRAGRALLKASVGGSATPRPSPAVARAVAASEGRKRALPIRLGDARPGIDDLQHGRSGLAPGRERDPVPWRPMGHRDPQPVDQRPREHPSTARSGGAGS